MNTPHPHSFSARAALTLAALGVVYGDIGTSPLYALREAVHAAGSTAPATILGVLSLITWALVLVVSVKYILFILKADNHGEGGILALTALALENFKQARSRQVIMLLGLAGAALFYGDAVITPAISVLGALEGLSVKSPVLTPLIIPFALIIMLGLFALQRHGTGRVGRWFGVCMLGWFGALAALGLPHMWANPGVLHALNPFYALHFASLAPGTTLVVLGAVVLAITGAEALYADLGHFGRRPIQLAWLGLAGPALLINYYGQGALVLANPAALENPFYNLAPYHLILPLVLLALVAAIIAAQAVISGAYSLTHQAVQLGYLPRMNMVHTDARLEGQLHIPAITALLFVGVVLVIVGFQTSSNLAAAYGIAVTGTMLITTVLAAFVFRQKLGWSWLGVGLFTVFFVALDAAFLTANLTKLLHGGWFPLVLGGLILFIMLTWHSGRQMAHDRVYQSNPTLPDFLALLKPRLKNILRPARTAVFMTSDLHYVPPALMYNLAHNNVLHAQVIILKVSRARVPRVAAPQRLKLTPLEHGLCMLEASYGFMETPNVPKIIKAATELKQQPKLVLRYPKHLSYFLAHHTFIASDHPALNRFQEPIFRALDALSLNAVSFFKIPKHQVVEVGNQIEV